MKSGIEVIAIERQEQIKKHNRSIENDVKENYHFQLASGAMQLIRPDEFRTPLFFAVSFHRSAPVSWDKSLWNKMMTKPYKERLIIAGALIAAEIDRLQYNEINPLDHENMKQTTPDGES